MDDDRKTVLIAGITGISGSYIAKDLAARPQWEVIGLSRRMPQFPIADNIRLVTADMLKPSDLSAVSDEFANLTHLVYAGYSPTESDDWAEQTSINAQMFENLLDSVCRSAPVLRRVLLMQGQKYYGTHLGPYRTPSREDDPRHMPPNFYFDQQDLLTARSTEARWDYSCLRPHIICGLGMRSPMNPLMIIGAYASLSKTLGLPLRYPGSLGAYRSIYQATDAKLLGRAAHWALTSQQTADQAYNITNGDFFRWEQIWEKVADLFGIPLGPPQSISLQRFMADKTSVWQQLAAVHGLVTPDIEKAVNWSFGDYIFNCDWDIMASTTKARQHGFESFEDSEHMFSRILTEMAEARMIPPL